MLKRAGIDTNSKQYQAVILFCSLGEVGGRGGRATVKPIDSRRSSTDGWNGLRTGIVFHN